jgi:predicted dienelactone hydrolase
MMRRVFRWLGVLLLVGLVTVPSGLAVLAWRHPDSLTLPAPTGPYDVGRIIADWRDDGRVDPFAPTPGTKRELPIWIWYPSARGTAQPRAEYMPPRLREAMQPNPPLVIRLVMEPLLTDRAAVTSHARLAAPLATHGPFPVILLKPNVGAAVAQNAVLAEDLASHGYVVVGSDSPYTTPGVAYQDGRIARRTAAGHPSETARGRVSERAPGQPNDFYLPVVDAWVKDNRFILDRLYLLNDHDPSGRFTGRLNLGAVGALGHSLGGATALQFCHEDARCAAAVNLDGMPYGEVVVTGLSKPFLYIVADRPVFHAPVSELEPGAREFLAAIERLRTHNPATPSLLLLEGAAHFNFFDQALLAEPTLWRVFGALGSADQTRLLDVTRRYVRAFFDTYLKRTRDQLLDGPTAEFTEVQFR